MNYGLNNNMYMNNTFTQNSQYNNAQSQNDKTANQFKDWTSSTYKTMNQLANSLEGWKNAKTGGEKIAQIVNAILALG